MEKRFVSFLLISLIVLIGYQFLIRAVLGPPPPRPVAQRPAAGDGQAEVEQPRQDEEPPAKRDRAEEILRVPRPDDGSADDAAKKVPAEERAKPPLQYVCMGSLAADSPYEMMAILCNEGGTIHSVELSSPRYRDLDRDHGYLGKIVVTEHKQGCQVQIVGAGSPAAIAGLRGPTFADEDGVVVEQQPGDVLTHVNTTPIRRSGDLEVALEDSRPDQVVTLQVIRSGEPVTLSAKLSEIPLKLLQVEYQDSLQDASVDPASYLLTLCQIGKEKMRFGADEIAGLPSLHKMRWDVMQVPESDSLGPAVEFRTVLTQDDLASLDLEGPVQIVKRFRMSKRSTDVAPANPADGFRLQFDIEIQNLGPADQQVAYQLDGPTGITTEGWWYLFKTHPRRFVSAGARDVAWREAGGSHQLFVGSEITKTSKKSDSPYMPMTAAGDNLQMRYVGCDTQYFAAMMMPHQSDANIPYEKMATDDFVTALAHAVGSPDQFLRRTNVTFRLQSRTFNIGAGETLARSYDLFLGPKRDSTLQRFGLQDLIVFGWFGWVSKPMLSLLHGLYWLTGKFSYGLAIILLTVLVRGAMFPFGLKMAKNAQKMQMLAPEMKKIAEKFKNDMEKRAAAQRELFQKHKYNPFSGCLVMFLQMPVFLGLYRGLSCDIELRNAPLIPGMNWCSNLAGPDMFWHWEGIVPGFLSSPTGFFGLGPYLNLLPIFAVVLFLVQQKLFTPPPQDEQQAMQHQIMKFMMVFMGFIFHKVAAGLCLYIITSTLWGVCERLLLPKPPTATADTSETVAVKSQVVANGAASKKQQRKKQPRR